MIKPKEITISDMDGNERKYIISRVPATQAREIITQYPISAIPKLGDYSVNEAMMLKLMAHVACVTDSKEIMLTTRSLIDNHVPDWETLAKIEMAMAEYNCSFFAAGKSSSFFEGLAVKAQALITKMLTDLLAQSSKSESQPPMN